MGLVIRFAVTFLSVFVAAAVLPATMFRMDSLTGGAIFAAVLALLNAFVRPVVMMLTCPLQLVTLGLSTLLINAVIFLAASSLASGLGAGVSVGGFVGALVAALVVSIVSWVVSIFVRH
jgi:putative membrane protein